MFISPELTEGARILDVLAHEMVHATTPGAGHGKPFKLCALKIGLLGPMRSTTAGPEFIAWTEALFKRIGPYPAGSITDMPKQSTRMLKCMCSACGYVARVNRMWLERAGPPVCPTDNNRMIATISDVPAKREAASRPRGGGCPGSLLGGWFSTGSAPREGLLPACY
jgi:hypothetical protein